MDPIRTFINRPIFTLMLITAIVVFGLNSYPKIGVDQMPDVDLPMVTVTTILPGADPEAIERTVTEPLEEALNSLSGLETLKSVNVENVSQLIVRFKLDRNVDIAAQDVRDRVQASLSKLPKDIQTPIIEKLDFGSAPVITLAVHGPYPTEVLSKVSEDSIKPAIQQITGVGAVDLLGSRKREITIVVDPVRLRAFGLAATDLVSALSAQNLDIPGGRTAESGVERTVKLKAEAESVDDIRDIIVASPMGSPIHLRDVADIVDGPAEARSSAALSGQSAIGLIVRKQSGGNTVKVADAVKDSLEQISKQLPAGAKIEVVTDGSNYIRASIDGVKEDLVLGGVLAVLVVLVFLRNWRSTLVTAVALPVSIIGTFAVMHALDFTFNVISMLALTLSIGLLIDDAIVVIENIVRHLEMGKSAVEAAVIGTKEIALAVMAVTLAVVAVFIPVAFMEGIVGRFFYQFGVTVAVAVVISYAVSMSLTPAFAARIVKHNDKPGAVSKLIESVLVGVEHAYRTALGAMLRHRLATMAVAVGILLLTGVLARSLKFTFMPEEDTSLVRVNIEMPMGARLEDTERQLNALDRQLIKLPGVKLTFQTAGAGVRKEVNKGEITVALVSIKQRNFPQGEFKSYLRNNLKVLPGVVMSVADVKPTELGGMRSQLIQFNLRSSDPKVLSDAVEKTKAMMLKNPAFVDVDTTYRTGKPELEVIVDRRRAAAIGIPAAPIGMTLRMLMGGDKIGDYREGGDTYEIKAKLPESVLADADALGSLQVRAPNGQLVEIRNIAEVKAGEGPSQIEHQAQIRQITLLADLKGMSLSEGQSIMNKFAATQLPATVQYEFDGQGKELNSTFTAFGMALLLGIVLVYIILAAQFESLVHPMSIMMALPFAVIGAIGGLLLAQQYMSIFAMIGIIMLMGLVTKNGILLVEFTNQVREQGKSTLEALLEAGPVRLRPILMTTIAMIAGMIPVATARGDGAESRVPMAIAVIGGLITSTFLTLGVVPVVYSLLDSLQGKIWKKKRVRISNTPELQNAE